MQPWWIEYKRLLSKTIQITDLATQNFVFKDMIWSFYGPTGEKSMFDWLEK